MNSYSGYMDKVRAKTYLQEQCKTATIIKPTTKITTPVSATNNGNNFSITSTNTINIFNGGDVGATGYSVSIV